MAGPVSEDNLLVWEALVGGPPGTPYECGVFKARLEFPLDYPMHPPKMYFTSAMWHPNIYPNGEVCISILHPPGEDPTHYEKVEERWSPVQSVEKILISVMSMLAGTCAGVTALCLHVSETARRSSLLACPVPTYYAEPNDESPANIDAAVRLLLEVFVLGRFR